MRLKAGDLARLREDHSRMINHIGSTKREIRLRLKNEGKRLRGLRERGPSRYVTSDELKGRIAELADKRYQLGLVYRVLERGY